MANVEKSIKPFLNEPLEDVAKVSQAIFKKKFYKWANNREAKASYASLPLTEEYTTSVSCSLNLFSLDPWYEIRDERIEKIFKNSGLIYALSSFVREMSWDSKRTLAKGEIKITTDVPKDYYPRRGLTRKNKEVNDENTHVEFSGWKFFPLEFSKHLTVNGTRQVTDWFENKNRLSKEELLNYTKRILDSIEDTRVVIKYSTAGFGYGQVVFSPMYNMNVIREIADEIEKNENYGQMVAGEEESSKNARQFVADNERWGHY